jgi:hypothetical protein
LRRLMPVGCVIDFFGCGWIWLLVLLLAHFLFDSKKIGQSLI